jgi:predicted nucleic acid-binding protein
MNVVVDASVWAGGLMPLDVHYVASYSWLRARYAARDVLIVPMLVLAEVASAVARRTHDPTLGTRAVQELLRSPFIHLMPIDRRLGQSAAQLAARLQLRGADAVYVALAQQLSLPLVTWDNEQRDRGAVVVTVQTP